MKLYRQNNVGGTKKNKEWSVPQKLIDLFYDLKEEFEHFIAFYLDLIQYMKTGERKDVSRA